MTQDDSIVYHRTHITSDGLQEAQLFLTADTDLREKRILAYSPNIIPIIFIPGVMGTNLCSKDHPGRSIPLPVWRPPNMDFRGILETLCALFTYWNKTPADRQRELHWEYVEVDPTGPIDSHQAKLPEVLLRQRGWGALLRQSYHPIMGKLQHDLNHIMELGKVLPHWQQYSQHHPADYGDSKDNRPLTHAELAHAARYRFDVWAAGYNWLQDNERSARDIIHYIDNRVLAWYTQHHLAAHKVILVTHSMGGLVSRAITAIHHYDKILGVVHGVEPSAGAPATYKRMRAGFEGAASIILGNEGAASIILGNDAAEVTAVLATAPGPLQLLPMPDYHDGQPWLMLRDTHTDRLLLRLPTTPGRAYEEIYASPAWYGLIPANHDHLINPAKLELAEHKTSITSHSQERTTPATPREHFLNTLKQVHAFHQKLTGRYHPETYVYFGIEGQPLAERQVSGKGRHTHPIILTDRRTWGEIIWEGARLDPTVDWQRATLDAHAHNGTVQGCGRTLRIASPSVPGDGTVPFLSSSASVPHAKAAFAHGCRQPGRYNRERPGFDSEGFPGYDHQDSYNDTRAQFATLYSVIKLASQAQWGMPSSARTPT